MGMGTFANSATIISPEGLKKLPKAGPAYQRLLDLIEEHDVDEKFFDENWIDGIQEEYGVELGTELMEAMDDIHIAFEEDTELKVYPFYYSDDDGDRYDDIGEGLHWSVDGVYVMTPEAKKIEQSLQDVRWTIYG